MNRNINKKIYEKKCPICEKITMVEQDGQGDCLNCGWYINSFGEENEDRVIFPNLLSFNKAKKLYKEGKILKPDLSDFLDGFMFYGEMEFWYNGLNCILTSTENSEEEIEFGWSPDSITYFANKEDFINNAKIGNEYVRDIWDKVDDPKYM